MKKGKKISVLQLFRLLLQVVFFAFLPALYIGAFNGVKQIYLAVIHQSFSSATISQLIEVIAILPVTILLGRFFCGWMCAFGSYSDFVYFISQKLFHSKWKISKQADRWMKYIKYGVLAVLVAVVWSFDVTLFHTASPWDVFGMIATIGKMPDFSYVVSNLTAGLVIFLAVTLASAMIERFFCRYLCPLGAVFALSSKLRIGKIKKPSAQCGNCRICTNHCAMGIPLYQMDSVNSGECINCMKCVTACPRGNTDFSIGEEDVRPLLAGVGTVAVMTGIYSTGNLTVQATGQTFSEVSGSQASAVNRIYKDGTYEGSGTGFRGGVTTVSVTVKGDKIVSVSTVSHGDDNRFYDMAYSTVSGQIVNDQSPNVDAVSGATYSSNGIMAAVADALDKAKISGTSSVVSSVSSAISPSSAEQKKKGRKPDDTVSSEQGGGESKSSASGTLAYKDGTYRGTAMGFRGITSVSVAVSQGKITTVNVESYQDDQKFFERAYQRVADAIISSQSAQVDAVSGATYSSNGIMAAVADALSSAKL